MYRPAITAQLNTAPCSCSYFQDTASSEPDASGQPFTREVIEAANVLCAMRADETTEHNRRQPTVPNLLHDPRLEQRSVVLVDNYNREDQSLDLIVRRKLQKESGTEHPVLHAGEHMTHISGYGIDSPGCQARVSMEVSGKSCFLATRRNREPCKNPASAEPGAEPGKKCKGNRYRDNPVYAERQRNRSKKRYWELCKDPVYLERRRKYSRERYRNNPAFAAQQRERQRQRYQNDPAFAEHQRVLNTKRYRNDPAFAKYERERYRIRHHNDPSCAARKRELQRALCWKNSCYVAERFSIREEASIPGDGYRQSGKSPGNPGKLSQTSYPVEATRNSSENLDGVPLSSLFSPQAPGIFTVPVEPISHE
ncbi:hypothetical protein [Endozoicomonas sp. SESOKO1]|uniref:hypothetical protein n=1 Tax=Endozoicomonas sp. SESOKO1 TaxID=2828742 RepID=UPI002147D3F7|nr:hypothetical protein [Endozoicomonas sp. SESOKO1]